MKYFCALFLSCFALFKSGAQTTLTLKAEDLIVFTTPDSDIRADTSRSYLPRFKTFTERPIFLKDSLIVFAAQWNVFSGAPKYFRFFKGNDTLILRCHPGDNLNRVFYNLVFQKGNYDVLLRSVCRQAPVSGREALPENSASDLLIKGIYISGVPYNKEAKTMPLGRILFKTHNLSDTTAIAIHPIPN